MFRRRRSDGSYDSRGRGGLPIRLILAAIVALISVSTYLVRTSVNPVTGESQRVAGLTPEDDVRMGLAALPDLVAQFGGEHPDARAQARVARVGRALLAGGGLNDPSVPYVFEFTLLSDERTVNAFALPGGQTFITAALLERLGTEGQLAGVLGHEIGHVVERHGAEHIARAQLFQGLTGAAIIASYDPSDPRSRATPAMAALIGELITMSYGRDDELECDRWGVRLMVEAGYDPRSMIDVMQVLKEAGGGRSGPEWSRTHPDPEHRVARIEQAIREALPQGVPGGLTR